ncbi:MAG: ABC transporter ATP-binding protein/permease [Butyrivibrio sp.]|jgi:ABC-type multidrug transport system fused ATPase/permease subunit|nr:ABC transporter ATP-binding protein/permease [Butyrivibrio sp.]
MNNHYANRAKQLWGDRENQGKYFKWLIAYSKPYLWKITGMMVLQISGTMLSIGMAIISKRVIDNATAGKSMLTALVLYIILLVISELILLFTELASTMLNEYYSFGIRKQVYDKILRSTWMETQRFHTGDLMTRMTSDAGNIANGVINIIPNTIELIIELIAVFVTLFIYSHFLAVFALCLAPVAGILSIFLGRKLKYLQTGVQESETAYRSFIQESLANILIVKAFANEDFFSDELVELRQKRFQWVWRKSKLGTGASAAMSATFELGYVAAFAYGVLQISAKAITFGTMTVFLQLVNRVQAPVVQLAEQIPGIASVLASAARVMEIQNIELEEHKEKAPVRGQIGVCVQNLVFGYNKDLILENDSFKIEPGEFVAIVGESGIGKTTLIRLLMSFITPNEGTIRYFDLNGQSEAVSADVRKFISYVPQGNTLFSGTLRKNLLMGNLAATEDEIEAAIELASCKSFIDEMPDGLDTVIGEKGHGVSEGQAQRLAIARALLRKSPFLILDEATSALDEGTELKVLGGLRQLSPRPTCLLVTHRRSVLQYCDRELKIEDRNISEALAFSDNTGENSYV